MAPCFHRIVSPVILAPQLHQWLNDRLGQHLHITDELTANAAPFDRHSTRQSRFTLVLNRTAWRISGGVLTLVGENAQLEARLVALIAFTPYPDGCEWSEQLGSDFRRRITLKLGQPTLHASQQTLHAPITSYILQLQSH